MAVALSVETAAVPASVAMAVPTAVEAALVLASVDTALVPAGLALVARAVGTRLVPVRPPVPAWVGTSAAVAVTPVLGEQADIASAPSAAIATHPYNLRFTPSVFIRLLSYVYRHE
jgi:hypothetical protein